MGPISTVSGALELLVDRVIVNDGYVEIPMSSRTARW